jgi:hypothetical protein
MNMKRVLIALLFAAPALAQTAQPTPHAQRTLADVARDRKLGIKGAAGFSAAESTAPRVPSLEAAYDSAVSAAERLQRQVDASPASARAVFYDCKMRYGMTDRTSDCINAAAARLGARLEAAAVKP